MAHEIPAEPGPTRIRFTDNIGGQIRKAVVRSSLLEEDTLVWVQYQKAQHLDPDDVRALRDFLTAWLRKHPASKASK